MSEHDSLNHRLVEMAGVASGFTDQHGQWVETSLDARRAVLAGFGLPSGTEAEARESLSRIEELRQGLMPALVPALAGAACAVAVRTGMSAAVWRLTDEAGETREGTAEVTDGKLLLPPLGPGYHALVLEAGEARGEATVVSAPARCWAPEGIADGARLWGVTAQVYGLVSAGNLGIGDYTDVAEAAAGSGALGADFLGLSPLHALFAADRTKYSPYAPSSRLFLESLHLDVTAIPGFEGSRAAGLFDSAEFRARLAELRAAPLVDHEAVWALKRPLLDALYEEFRARGEDPEFAAFRRAAGVPLERHAAFEALSEHFHAEGRLWMGEWPEEFRTPGDEVVGWFCEEKADLVSFHAWLQFLADRQLAAAAARAREAGMTVGLYRDLAVGGDRGGSEVWAEPDLFSKTLSIGAPPDPLGPQGQNWGLPPMDPFALERSGLRAFRALVTANMRHAGAIRIDHAFQLRRLFLIPESGRAADGAYVAFPFEALLAALRLESHRAKCLVIAEDLGTAPEGFSDAIMRSGILSYRVMFFERGEHGRFKKPFEYPRDAMSVFTTHDLPTLRGWWRGLDVDLRQTLGVFDAERSDNERAGRRHDVEKFCEALNEEGLTDSRDVPTDPPLDAAVRYVARAPSALTAIQYEDAANELNQANLPGLDHGHPNWRRRLSKSVQELNDPDGQLARWARLMAGEGRYRV